MSIKNQSRLPIFALMIIGGTVLSLVGLNYLVENISKKKPAQMAQKQPPSPPRNLNGKDDEVAPPLGAPELMNPQDKGPELPRGARQYPDMNRMMPPPGMGNMGNNGNGVMRHMQKGNRDPNIERTAPPIERGDKNNGNNGPGKMPPPRDQMGYPPPPGNNFRPSEEDIMRMEMERRRMMESFPPGPPPGYYNRDDRYDGPYDGPPDDYYDDYDPGYEGKLDDKSKEDIRTSHSDPGEIHDDLEDPDFQLEDEYLSEFLDEDEDEE